MRVAKALVASSAALLLLSPPAATAAASQAGPQTYVIVLDKMKFGALPAKLRRGDSIVWINHDLFRHSATAANKSFDVDLAPGGRRKMAVTSAGAIPFACKYHPGMRGVLRVAAR